MNILGIGTDICECDRIARMIEKHSKQFLERVYTAKEIEYCGPRKTSVQHFTGRWAAKEAILKALGTGWTKGIMWTDLEILNQAGGEPFVKLHQRAAEIFSEMGGVKVLVSISHTATHAVAFAMAVRESP